jgi:hypothetical protein
MEICKKDDSRVTDQEKTTIQITDRENDIISRYGAQLEKRSGFLGRESDLPAPKEEIRTALLKALQHPVYALGRQAVDLCLKALDTYVPDEEYDKTRNLISRCFDLAERGDSESFLSLWDRASSHQRNAFQAVVDMVSKPQFSENELHVLERKLQEIGASVKESSKSRKFTERDLDRSWSPEEIKALSEAELTKLAFLRDYKSLVFFLPAAYVLSLIAGSFGPLGKVIGWLGVVMFSVFALQGLCNTVLSLISFIGTPFFEKMEPAKKIFWRFLRLLISFGNFAIYSALGFLVYKGMYNW